MNRLTQITFMVLLLAIVSPRILQKNILAKERARILARSTAYYLPLSDSEFLLQYKTDFKDCHKLAKSADNVDSKYKKAVLAQIEEFRNYLFYGKKELQETDYPLFASFPYVVGDPAIQSPQSLSFIHKIYTLLQNNSEGHACNDLLESINEFYRRFLPTTTVGLKEYNKLDKNLLELLAKKNKIKELKQTLIHNLKILTEQKTQPDKVIEYQGKLEKIETELPPIYEQIKAMMEQQNKLKTIMKIFNMKGNDDKLQENKVNFEKNSQALIHFSEKTKTNSGINPLAKKLISKLSVKLYFDFVNERTGETVDYQCSGFLLRNRPTFEFRNDDYAEMTHLITAKHCFTYEDKFLKRWTNVKMDICDGNLKPIQSVTILKVNFPNYFSKPIEDNSDFNTDFYSFPLPVPIRITDIPASTIYVFPKQDQIVQLVSDKKPKVYVAGFPSSAHTRPNALKDNVDWKNKPEDDLVKLSIVELSDFSELPIDMEKKWEAETEGLFVRVFKTILFMDKKPVIDIERLQNEENQRVSQCNPASSSCFGQTLSGMSGGMTVEAQVRKNKVRLIIMGIHTGVDHNGKTMITRRYGVNWFN